VRLLILPLAVFLTCSLNEAAAQVRVSEGTLTIPTYEEGPPDPNPPFAQFSTTFFSYPYTLRENLTDRRVTHSWRAVFLENEYLKCSVLPDIGGHLYTCVDKLSGQPMFYANPSIKKARIGYRGAWAAFGMEFNFPVSHNWVSMSPVTFDYATNADGSASVRVNNIDRVYGMEWSVELILRPGSTVLEERVTLNNRSDTRHRFYWWNNAGIEVKDDTRIVYPMRFTASHGFKEVDTWPVDSSGDDLSLLRNHTKGPVSLFAHGSREPFMGVWRPDTGTGTVHYADYGALPAKKIWSWGADADGLDWRKALSDNNSAYVEVQAGLFRNQETYAFLEPRKTIRFSEYWMPARGIGGITRANLAGVLHLQRDGATLTAALNSNQTYRGAVIRILEGAQLVEEERVDLQPERPWSKTVKPVGAGVYSIEVRDSRGTLLLQHTENTYDWTPVSEIQTGPQTSYEFPPSARRTEDDWVELGKEQELNGMLLAGMLTYEQGLAAYPTSLSLLKAGGRLAAGLLRYDEAIQKLEPAAARLVSDPEVAYYLGIAYEGVGRNREAQTAYENAARLPGFREAGRLRLAELRAKTGKLEEALALLQPVSGDLRVIEETVALENAAGRTAEAQSLAREGTKSATSLFLEFEQAKRPYEDPRLMRFLAADPERVLNVASEYIRLGLYRRAHDVLSQKYPGVTPDETEPGAVLPQDHPLVAYYRAYCREKLKEPPNADDPRAGKMSIEYIFPSGETTLDVLQAAIRRNSQDATALYLLGTLYFSNGQTDAAIAAWEKVRRLNPRMPVLHASLGRALLHERGEPEQSLEVFQEGTSADPVNAELYVGMDQALSLLGRSALERAQALQRYPDQAALPVELVYKLALNRAEAGDFEGALALFQGRFFPHQEGGTNVRQVWVEVHLQQMLELARSGKCEQSLQIARDLGKAVPSLDFTHEGMEPFVQSARVQYFMGVAESQCGQGEAAAARLWRVVASVNPSEVVWAHRAARLLPGYEDSQWRPRLEAALARVEEEIDARSFKGLWVYAAGMLEQDLDRPQAAQERFRQVMLLPDRMLSLHFSRLAMADHTAP
jgi:tetratricopeptide (TPR) repeat protein